MLAPLLIFIGCHLFLVICLAISWQLLETENARQPRNNHHLLDFQPYLDEENRPHLIDPALLRRPRSHRPGEIMDGPVDWPRAKDLAKSKS